MKKTGRSLQPQSGQTLLELALLLPLFLLLLMGIFDVGRYMYQDILVANAARAGAAYGAQNLALSSDTPGIQAAAQNDYQNSGGVSALTVTSFVSCGCDTGGSVTLQGNSLTQCSAATNPALNTTCAGGHYVNLVTVTAAGTYSAMFNYPGIPATMTVSSTATMRVAQ